MPDHADLTRQTHLLDFRHPSIERLVAARGWRDLGDEARIGAAYDFVRDGIRFGYNAADDVRASRVLADGYGQCNTKGTLLMALLRALDVPCRLHGFAIHKGLQRGVVPELVYPIAPDEILHSWVEVWFEGRWINLEGFILDRDFLAVLQRGFKERQALCGYGAGTSCLSAPGIEWQGRDTYIQKEGIVRDYGVFAAPDDFYAAHRQAFGAVRGFLYRHVIRHWMNARVAAIRQGRLALDASALHRHEGRTGDAPLTES